MNELRINSSQPLAVWTQRLDQLREMKLETGVLAHTPATPLEPEGNILWMLEIEQWKSALDLMGGSGALTCAMAHHFDEVVYFDARPSMAAFARRRLNADGVRNVIVREGDPTSLPYASSSFDWIAAQDLLDALVTCDRSEPRRRINVILAECRRILRPGGGLYLRAANSRNFATGAQFKRLFGRAPLESNRSAPATALSPRWLHSALRDADFEDVRLYYVDPSREQPWALIPATRSAVHLYESRRHFLSASGRVRRSLARAGLHSILYGAVVALAYV